MAFSRRTLAWAVGATSVLGGMIRAVELTLGFEGQPERITGAPGEVKSFEVFVTLTTRGNDSPDGAQGWSIIVRAEGGTIQAISLDGLRVSTIFNHDGKADTPPLDPFDFNLENAGFQVNQLWDYPGESRQAVSSVVLHLSKKMVLQPSGTQRIARVTVEAVVPEGGDCIPLTLRLLHCLGHGLPVCTVITQGGASHVPQKQPATVLVCPALFRRGDGNSDRQVDISDVLFTLSYLYVGGAAPGCLDAADVNDDGEVDLTDAIFLMTDLFSPFVESFIPPPGPFQCGRDQREDVLGCDSYPSCS